MIKFFKKPLPISMYLLVILGGISILFMLVIEYKDAKLLINDNQFLMRNTVVKTLVRNISDKLADYPSSSSEIDSSWRNLSSNFLAKYQNEWIFPNRFYNERNDSLSVLWKIYELGIESKETKNLIVSAESKLRINTLHKIKTALKNNDKKTLTKQVENYFLLVENYRLSALEETISSLSFLQLEENSQWNTQLIQLVIFDGSSQVHSLIEYIFRQSNNFSTMDLKLAINKIQLILENANIDSSWFNQSVVELWKPNPLIDIEQLDNYSIIQNKWVLIRTPNELELLLPFDISSELKIVENSLKSQGILDHEDKLSIDKAKIDGLIKVINKLPFKIDRATWRKQVKKQYYFFMIKVVLTLIFTLSLFMVVVFVLYRNKKKAELINLRENFVNLVSHELKTPLASIRIMIETLKKRNLRGFNIKDYPDKIIHEVDRLWLMVDNLLSLNQIKSGKLEINISPVNLTSLFNRISNRFLEYQHRELVINNKLPKDYVNNVDQLLFELVMINLLSNAIKYCHHEKVEVSISLSSQKNSIILVDNGQGIAPENWNKIFESFFRENASSAKQGTGIGLSLCNQIMKAHHGSIVISDSSEYGTTWEINFPSETRILKNTSGD